MYDAQHLVESNPNILDGTPVFSGTEVPAKYLFDYLESGDTLDDFISAYPAVSRAEAQAVLNFAREATLNIANKVT